MQFSCQDSGGGGAGTYCDPDMSLCNDSGTPALPDPRWCTLDVPASGEGERFEDILTLDDASLKLQAAVNGSRTEKRPFFLGVGLRKPHLDWRFPAPFLQHYPSAAAMGVPRYPTARPHVPQISFHDPGQNEAVAQRWQGFGYQSPWQAMPNSTLQVRPPPWCEHGGRGGR